MTGPGEREGGEKGEIRKLRAKNEELESRVRQLRETLDAIHSSEANTMACPGDDIGKGARVAVDAERQRLYDVLDTLPAYVVLLSEDYHVPFANRFFRERFGESHGKRCYEYLFQRSEPCENCETYKVLKTGQPHHWEWLGPDGRNYVIFDYLFRNSDGSRLIMEVGIDITEQKKAHEELERHRDNLEALVSERTKDLRESEGHLRILYESMSEGLANYEIVYEDGNAVDYIITDVNPAFERITGLTRAVAVGRKATELYGTGNPPHLDVYARVAAGSGPEHFETYFPPMKQHFSVSAFSPGKGKFATVFTDITDRRQAEEALRESEERFRTLFLGLPFSTVVFQKTGDEFVAREYNQAAVAFTGGRMPEFVGRSARELYGPHPDILKLFDLAWEQKNAQQLQKSYRMVSTGKDIFLNLTLAFIPPDRILMHSEDISREKEADARIAHLASFPEQDPNPVLELDPSGEVIYINAAASRALENLGLGNNPGLFLPEGTRVMLPRLLEGDVIEEVKMGERVFLETITLNPSTKTTRIYPRDITERKQAEEALRETSQYLENLINYANAPIIVWDPEFHITRFNHAFERLTGLAAEEVVGRGLEILFPAESAADSMDYIRKAMTGERWEVVEIPIIHKNGTIRTVLWNSVTLYEADGKTVSSAIAQGQDITERKQMEEELHDTSQYLENLINYANAPIVVWDTQFRITRFNQAFERLTGRSAEEVTGKSLEILLPEETAAESMDLIRKAMAGERWEIVEIPVLHRDGGIRTVLWNSATLYEADGKTASSAIAQGMDVTEQKRMVAEVAQKVAELGRINVELKTEVSHRKNAEEAVRKTLSTLHAALESTADAMLVVDRAGRITSYNQNFTTMWNMPESVLTTLDTRAAIEFVSVQTRDPDAFLVRIREISDHPPRESYDMLELLDGRIIERYSKPQRIGNTIVGRVYSFRDITERKKAELQLIESLNEKEVLLREIHHRVKNNLQLTTSLLDMTRMRTTDPGTAGILTDVMMKIQTMAQIHTRLYESKQFDRINMDRQIRDQVQALTNIYLRGDQEIRIEIDSPELYLPLDKAIPCALALNEILSNAYKHAFKGRRSGTVKYSAREEEGGFRFTISDNGIGLPRGFDLSKANTLGLKLVRTLVEQQLKGSLRIRRRKGTEVIVEIPLEREEEHVESTRS